MAATQAAVDFAEMLRFVHGNVNSLNEGAVILRDRLSTWRIGFFPILDQANPEESKIHDWVIPSIIMGNGMADTLTFYEVEDLATMLTNQIAALAFNGYVNPAIEAAAVAAYNAAWT